MSSWGTRRPSGAERLTRVRLAAAVGAVVSAGLYVGTAASPDRSLGDDLLSFALFVAVGTLPFVAAGVAPLGPRVFLLALAVAAGLEIIERLVLQDDSNPTSGVAMPGLPFIAFVGVLMVAGFDESIRSLRDKGRVRASDAGGDADGPSSTRQLEAPADAPVISSPSGRPSLLVRFLRGDPPLTEPVDMFAWYGWLAAWSIGVVGIAAGRDWIITPAGVLITLIGAMLTTNFRGLKDRLRVREERSRWQNGGQRIGSTLGGLVVTVIGLAWLYIGLGDLLS